VFLVQILTCVAYRNFIKENKASGNFSVNETTLYLFYITKLQ